MIHLYMYSKIYLLPQIRLLYIPVASDSNLAAVDRKIRIDQGWQLRAAELHVITVCNYTLTGLHGNAEI